MGGQKEVEHEHAEAFFKKHPELLKIALVIMFPAVVICYILPGIWGEYLTKKFP